MQIKISHIKLFMLLIPLFQPKLFTQIPLLTNLYIVLNIYIFIREVIYLFNDGCKLPYITFVWLLYRFYILFIGIINSNVDGLLQWGYLTLMVSNMLLIFARYGSTQFTLILKYISIITTVLLIINYITLLIYPRGIIQSTFYDVTAGDYYLLGIKTQFTTMMFPALASSILYMYIKKDNGSFVLFIISVMSCLLNIFNKSISTAIVGLFLCGVLYLISRVLKYKYTGISCLCIGLIANISIVFFRLQNVFSGFIINVLHKDTTMSSRVHIWNNAIKLIEDQNFFNLVFGNGLFKNQAFVPYGSGYWQPHNQLLALLYPIGLVGMCIFIYFIYLLLRKSDTSKEAQTLLIICLCVLILCITEVYFDVAVCYIPFILMFYFDEYKKKRDNCI